MKYIILSFIFLGQVAFAQNYSCPKTQRDYADLLSDLQSFSGTLNRLNCKELSGAVEELTGLLSGNKREEVMSMLGKYLLSDRDGDSLPPELSASDAELLETYISSSISHIGSVTERLVGIASGGTGFFEGIFGTDSCAITEEDKKSGIEKLTNAAHQISGLAPLVAGPYGVPIQIGMSVFSGILKGVDSYAQGTRHIDYSSLESRLSYESSICMMVNYEEAARKLRDPEAHLKELQEARSAAMATAKAFQSCDFCKEVAESRDSNEAARLLSELADPLAREVAEDAYEEQQKLEWIQKEIERFGGLSLGSTTFRGLGPGELSRLQSSISDFLLNVATPDFLKWYSSDAGKKKRELRDQLRYVNRLHRREVREGGVGYSYDLPESIESEYGPNGYPLPGSVDYYDQPSLLYYETESLVLIEAYRLNQNKDQLDYYSSEFYSQLDKTYHKWLQFDSDVRIVKEYCLFFKSTYRYDRKLAHVCEGNTQDWDFLNFKSSYLSFYLANVMSSFPNLVQQKGPYRFDLADHRGFIRYFNEEYERATPILRVAQEGIDLDQVLAENGGGSDKDLGYFNFTQDWLNPDQGKEQNLGLGERAREYSEAKIKSLYERLDDLQSR